MRSYLNLGQLLRLSGKFALVQYQSVYAGKLLTNDPKFEVWPWENIPWEPSIFYIYAYSGCAMIKQRFKSENNMNEQTRYFQFSSRTAHCRDFYSLSFSKLVQNIQALKCFTNVILVTSVCSSKKALFDIKIWTQHNLQRGQTSGKPAFTTNKNGHFIVIFVMIFVNLLNSNVPGDPIFMHNV